MDPKATLKKIQTYANLIASEDPIRLQTLIDLENAIFDLRRWIDKGGFVPEGLDDNRR